MLKPQILQFVLSRMLKSLGLMPAKEELRAISGIVFTHFGDFRDCCMSLHTLPAMMDGVGIGAEAYRRAGGGV